MQPYRDFVAPRAKAQANPKNLINAGRAVAHFRRKNDPSSLQIRRGFEPDFENGMLEQGRSRSKLYGGELSRYRFLSMNRKIQYYFIAGKRHVWLLPLQSLTTELSTYGVRVIDVTADDDLFLPGYEYHFFESTQDGQRLYSQIPHGFAGDVCEADDAKADASPWLDQIPLIQEFRNRVLGKSKKVRLKK